MNTKITTMMAVAVLATALVFPNIGPVDAAEFRKTAMIADTSDDLKPKAYGEKTKKKVCSENPCFNQNGETHLEQKEHKIKEMKKATEQHKAAAFMKTYYRI